MNEWYVQDKRSYVGNDIKWWGVNSAGYTCNLSKAHVFTKQQAFRLNKARSTDVPWPKKYIDGKTNLVVDMQYVSYDDAMKEEGQ